MLSRSNTFYNAKQCSEVLSVLSEGLLAVLPLEVGFVVDVVMSALWIPVRVPHFVLVLEVLLGSPSLRRAVWVLRRWEWTFILWNVNLILRHQVVQSGVLLVFEPSVRNTEIVVGVDNEGQLTWDWIPRVLVHFPNGRITENHLGHLIIGTRWPENLCLLTL